MRPEELTPVAVSARDRVQHFIVAAIADRQATRRRLVFKGGTLLRSCWHLDYRYFEDLDFDWVTNPEETREDLGLFLRSVLRDASRASGVDLAFRDRRGRLAVTWAAPDGPSGVISLDVNRRTHENYTPAIRDWHVHQRYPDLTTDAPISGYTLEAVMAGKLDCLAEPARLAPRDFFDVHELLKSRQVDTSGGIEAFMQLRHPSTDTRPSLDELHEHLLTPGYEHYADLVSEWSKSVAKGLVSSTHRDFSPIFDAVDTMLSEVITQAIERPPEPEPPKASNDLGSL